MGNSFLSLLLIVIVVVAVRMIMAYGGPSVNVQELRKLWNIEQRAKGVELIDVRQPSEFSAGRVPGALNIPLGELEANYGSLQSAQTVYVICLSGNRSAAACQKLAAKFPDKRVVNVEGGTSAWIGSGFPVEQGR